MTSEGDRSSKTVSMLAEFCTAIRFLTVLPVTWRGDSDSENFSSCLRFFPVVGALIGLIGATLTYLVLLIFPPSVAAVSALVYLAFVSNCLHLDGLSDSGDGLLSSRSRKESLTIMKDSRVGAMGVIVVVFVMLMKFSALNSLGAKDLCVAVFFMPFGGRSVIVFSMATLRYGREEGGLGELFYSRSSKGVAIVSSIFLGLLLVGYDFKRGLLAFSLLYLGAMIFNTICKSKLGGATGDTLGANCEIGEMMIALSFSSVLI